MLTVLCIYMPAIDRSTNDGGALLKQTHVWVRGDDKHRLEVASVKEKLLRYTQLFGKPIGVQLYDCGEGYSILVVLVVLVVVSPPPVAKVHSILDCSP